MNLILSTAAGYNWGQLEIFVKSLRKIFREKVILVLNNPNTDLVNKLKDFNIDFLDTKIVPSDSYQSRYQHYYNYLKNNKLILGTWQGIYLFEHRIEQQIRKVFLHILGEK